jgi:hypothetical protein
VIFASDQWNEFFEQNRSFSFLTAMELSYYEKERSTDIIFYYISTSESYSTRFLIVASKTSQEFYAIAYTPQYPSIFIIHSLNSAFITLHKDSDGRIRDLFEEKGLGRRNIDFDFFSNIYNDAEARIYVDKNCHLYFDKYLW